MNILITGASGFIGSHTIQHLSQHANVTLYALSRNTPVIEQKNTVAILANLTDANFETQLPPSIDCIVHLAQSDAYREFPEKANEIFDVNLNATQRLLNWAYNNKVKKFIFASSGNVYKQQNKLLNETDTCQPEGYYGASKYAAEQLVKAYSHYFEVCLLRIFGVYGPNQKNMTIPNIIHKIKNNQEITLANNEGLWFTPLYINDCAQMITKVILQSPTQKYSVYNIAGNESISLAAFIQLVAQHKNYKPLIKVTTNNPMYLMGDASTFYKAFNFSPTTTLAQGLKKILEHH